MGLDEQPLVSDGGLLQLLGLGLGNEDVAVLMTILLSVPEGDAEQLGLDLGEDAGVGLDLGDEDGGDPLVGLEQ